MVCLARALFGWISCPCTPPPARADPSPGHSAAPPCPWGWSTSNSGLAARLSELAAAFRTCTLSGRAPAAAALSQRALDASVLAALKPRQAARLLYAFGKLCACQGMGTVGTVPVSQGRFRMHCSAKGWAASALWELPLGSPAPFSQRTNSDWVEPSFDASSMFTATQGLPVFPHQFFCHRGVLIHLMHLNVNDV